MPASPFTAYPTATLSLPLKILIDSRCRNLFPSPVYPCATVEMLNGSVAPGLEVLYPLLSGRLFSSLLSRLTLGRLGQFRPGISVGCFVALEFMQFSAGFSTHHNAIHVPFSKLSTLSINQHFRVWPFEFKDPFS
jgi:hypothetical protein